MINPDDIFDLFPEDSPSLENDMSIDDTWNHFDRGRMLGSLIIRKVSELITTYQGMDALKDPNNKAAAKNRTLAIYNKIILSYLKKDSTNNIHLIRGLAYEDAKDLPQILDTLTKYFERKEDFNTCAFIQSYKEELLYQDLTRELWLEEYGPLE